MRDSDIHTLQRLFDLKGKGIISESEYERKKIEFLSAESSVLGSANPIGEIDRRLRHGVSLLLGGVLLFVITAALLGDKQSTPDQLSQALGFIIIFACWLVPHSIWLIGKSGANIVLPIIALAILCLCGLCYAGSV